MKTEIITFIKTYALNILLIIVFVGIFVLTQFIHNVHVYKWLFIEYLTGFGYEGEINANNKFFLQKFLFSLPLIGCSILVDYFRSLFYPKEGLTRLFIIWTTLFIIFFINWIIFELFGSIEYKSLYHNRNIDYIFKDIPLNSVNLLLIINFIITLILMVGILILEKFSIVQRFNNYIKNMLLQFGDTEQK